MESLIAEPGPKNPLLFLCLSLVNRVPGYNPDEKETLNQLECLNDLITSVSVSIFRLESLKNPVAVAADSLMSIAIVEAKKSISVRISALESLKLLIGKLVASGIESLIEIIPGILSKVVKISTGRVDVEVDRIIQLSLDIINMIICCFFEEQDRWVNAKYSDEEFVILKQRYRENIDMIVCSLRPIIKSRRRSFYQTLLNIFQNNLMNSSLSCSSLKLYLILTSSSNENGLYNNFKVTETEINFNFKKLVDIYNDEIIEWFDVNSNNLKEIHEEILIEKVEIIFGLINLKCKNKKEFIIISDLFTIIKKLTELKVSTGGDTVSIEYSDETNSLSLTVDKSRTTDTKIKTKSDAFKLPRINFETKLKLSEDFRNLIESLIEKTIEIDFKAVENILFNFEDETIEGIIQKLDLTSAYYKTIKRIVRGIGGEMVGGRALGTTITATTTSTKLNDSLLKDCLKYHDRLSIRTVDSQLIHLATLKLLLSISETFPHLIRANLLIILSGITSGWIILKEAATQVLKAVSKGKCREYIKEHEIFLLDRLGIQLSLPAFYPESPQIISCLVRDILSPNIALKFTDLLVKKVSDNLALYQGYPVYCKDLLTVAMETIETISKRESLEFIDPKNFAFDVKSDASANDDELNRSKDSPLNCQQRIIIDLLKIGINFILSDSKLIRSKSIDLITFSVKNFTKYNDNNLSSRNTSTSSNSNSSSNRSNEPSEICQLIHVAWPNMIEVLKDSSKDFKNSVQLDVLVVESFTSCSSILFEKFPLFMRDRLVKDFWRLILKQTKTSKGVGINSAYSSCSIKILKLLFNTLNCGILNCKPSTEICLEILNHLIEVSNKASHFDDEIFKSISSIEPDLIWYFYFIELGEIDEIISPFSELKSFKIHYKNNFDKIILKSKLKQFIIK